MKKTVTIISCVLIFLLLITSFVMFNLGLVVSAETIAGQASEFDIVDIMRTYDRNSYEVLMTQAARYDLTRQEVEDMVSLESVREFMGDYIGDSVYGALTDGQIRVLDSATMREFMHEELDNILEESENAADDRVNQIPQSVINLARDPARRESMVNLVANHIENQIDFNQINEDINENASVLIQMLNLLMSVAAKIILVIIIAALCVVVLILNAKTFGWLLGIGLATLLAGVTTLITINIVGDVTSNMNVADVGSAIAIRLVDEIAIILTGRFQMLGFITIAVGTALLIGYFIVKVVGVGTDSGSGSGRYNDSNVVVEEY